MKPSHHRLIIIGTGPAGYTAAIYSGRAGLAPMVFEGIQPGGQLTITTEIENYPGFSHGIPGPVLMEELREQALRFGTEVRPESVESVILSGRPFIITTNYATYTADALVVATGASAKWLGLGKDLELSRNGGGVSACATCDGYFYRGKEIAVVGGGDTALEEAIYLTKFASKVHLLHRRDVFRASKAMQRRAIANKKIEIHWNREVTELLTIFVDDIYGGKVEKLSSLLLKDTITGELCNTLQVSGLFVAIGHQPNTSLFQGQLPLDESGYLLVEKGSTRTAIPGVFAAGDVSDHTYRQAITAAGSGCMAAIDAERWLTEQQS